MANPIPITIVGDSLTKYFSKTKPKKYVIHDRFERGATLQSHLAYLQKHPIDQSSQAVIIHIGTNSINNSKLQCWKEFQQLLTLIHQQVPQAKLCIVSILPKPLNNHQFTPSIRDFNKLLKQMATQHQCRFANIFKSFWKRPGLFGKDGIHLTHEGYAFLHNQYLQALALTIK